MIKRLFLLLLILSCVLTCTVSASDDFSLSPDGEFYIYGRHNEEIAEILGIAESEIKEYCGKNVVYLAMNKDNSKQIRITAGQNAFTYSVVNISNFSNDKIISLSSQIIGIDGIKGEVVNKNGQKFIKTELRGKDSGGDYILTEYITVADKRSYVLSFYTNIDTDTDYIDNTFKTFNSVYFAEEKQQSNSIWQYALPVLTVMFAIISAVIAVSVVIDIAKKRKADSNSETQEILIEE